MSNLTVIIPAYNEQKALPELLERLDAALVAAKISYKAILVDDHSSDNTLRIARKLEDRYPLLAVSKNGVRGKAQSIIEGAKLATTEYVVMIDADLQYPPEAIPEMFRFAKEVGHGVVGTRRKVYTESTLRRFGSRAIAFVSGRLLHGIDCDIQSGLKLFRKDILRYVDSRDITPWSLDLPLLHTAKELGYTIGEIEIDFAKRLHGESKLSLVGPTIAIMSTAVKLKFRRISPEQTLPTGKGSMTGAGVRYRGKQFVTHSTLHHSKSALTVITAAQRSFLMLLLGAFLLGIGLNPLATFQIVVAILSFIYFVDVIFNFFLILKSLHTPPEIHATPSQIAALKDRDLPMYTILCPLYKEAHVIPQFVSAIDALDWPKDKLEVMLLLEEDDRESIEAVKLMKLPAHIRAVVVPDSAPKTKPKACNYGLNQAKGEYVVIYDAEDKPDTNQLKIAYLAFQTVGPEVKCLQAKLNYYNPSQNWLTRLFTAEYSLWFDVILTGLQSIGTTIPLGGTSNHFRTRDLLDFEGWDPFNVTEDCDLGVRLFKTGAKTAIIDSTTLEEANSNFRNWIRQRSRWIKGYMQTYLLHMRNPKDFAVNQGMHAILFQLTVGGKIAFILINPILWILTIAYFVLYQYVGPTIESLYPTYVFYMAVISLIFGNFMFIYYYMIGAAKRGHWALMKWIYLIPLYWLMVSIAGAMALYQLIVKPHYWEKTIHGLHLKEKTVRQSRFALRNLSIGVVTTALASLKSPTPSLLFLGDLSLLLRKFTARFSHLPLFTMIKMLFVGKYNRATFLVIASVLANGLNMVSSIAVGHALSFSDFALYSTISSLLYLVYIPTGSFSAAINFKTSYLLGKHQLSSIYPLWRHYMVRSLFLALALFGLWLAFMPISSSFLHHTSYIPLILFAPTIIFGVLNSVNEGYLRATLYFHYTAVAVVLDPLVRFALILLAGYFHLPQLILAVPAIGMAVGFFVLFCLTFWHTPRTESLKALKEFRFPWGFFAVTALVGLSSIAFFSLDTVLAAHFLAPEDAGKYGLLGVLGKIMYFAGGLTAAFILPFISREEGQGKDSRRTFTRLFMLTAVMVSLAQVAIGIILPLSAELIGSPKLMAIRHLLPIYGLGILFFTLSQTISSYYIARREYIVAVFALTLAFLQMVLLWQFHASLEQFVWVMVAVGTVNCVVFGWFHINYLRLQIPLKNITDLTDLFATLTLPQKVRRSGGAKRILFFNWRDTRHVWAGGAEVYIHELAKRLATRGYEVTIFSGNDGKSSRNDVIDGVKIIRRGGAYTVYIWAAIYYLLLLRKTVDIVIDSENGIPFLTPLYVHKPIFLLIHHVHQDILRQQLRFPLSEIAAFVEGDLMPMLYRRKNILTVSSSSRQDIMDLGLGTISSIGVVSPGVDIAHFHATEKTRYPSCVYVGRLKHYKQIDVAIRAFALLLKEYPTARFTIAGVGEADSDLKALVQKLGLEASVEFANQVTQEQKVALFGQSWMAIQPSSVEGYGITVIEANACGTPVIASRVKGLQDSVLDGETGMLFPNGDAKALYAKMQTLVSDRPLRLRMSSEALKWAKENDWNKKTTEFEAILTGHSARVQAGVIDAGTHTSYGN